MQLQVVLEEIMCRVFPMALRGPASVWFNKLDIGGHRRGRPPTHLLNIKQMEGESLRAYVHRFNKESLQIDRPKEDVTLTTIMTGLRKGDFFYDLCKDSPETLSELMYEAQKHMNVKDAIESWDDPPPKRRKDVDDRKHEPTKQKVPKLSETSEKRRVTAPGSKFSSFTPLNTPIDQLLMQIQDDPSLRWPRKIRSDPDSRAKNLYCRFHRDHGLCVFFRLSLTSITPSKQIFTHLSSSSLPFLNQTHKSTYLKSQTYKPTNLKPQAHITKPKNQFPCLSHKPTKSLICFFKGISPSHLSLIVEWGMTAVPFSRGGGRLLAPISGRLR
jgi:hypothetical protein